MRTKGIGERFGPTVIWIVLAASVASAQVEIGPAPPPRSTLPSSAQSTVSASMGRDDGRFQIRRSGPRWHAENAPHRLAADFDTNGVQLTSGKTTWGLRLDSYGYGD